MMRQDLVLEESPTTLSKHIMLFGEYFSAAYGH